MSTYTYNNIQVMQDSKIQECNFTTPGEVQCEKCVFFPANKAANNVVVVCPLLKQEINGTMAYIETFTDELINSHSNERPQMSCLLSFL